MAASVAAPGSNAGSMPLGSPASQSAVNLRDPLANIRESEKKHDWFDYRPELADPKKLI